MHCLLITLGNRSHHPLFLLQLQLLQHTGSFPNFPKWKQVLPPNESSLHIGLCLDNCSWSKILDPVGLCDLARAGAWGQRCTGDRAGGVPAVCAISCWFALHTQVTLLDPSLPFTAFFSFLLSGSKHLALVWLAIVQVHGQCPLGASLLA